MAEDEKTGWNRTCRSPGNSDTNTGELEPPSVERHRTNVSTDDDEKKSGSSGGSSSDSGSGSSSSSGSGSGTLLSPTVSGLALPEGLSSARLGCTNNPTAIRNLLSDMLSYLPLLRKYGRKHCTC